MRRKAFSVAAMTASLFGASAAAQPAVDAKAYRDAPLVTSLYFADPSAHVFDGRLYVYGTHDITGPAADDQPGKGFVARDYQVLSMDKVGGSVTVHPPALKLEEVPWASRQLWAPDAAYKNGLYYLYFPAKDRDGVFRIGVATGERPEGPFKARAQPIANSFSIDPSVFTDDDSQSYLYFGGIHGGQLQRWSGGRYDPAGSDTDLGRPQAPALTPKVARLGSDMLEFAEPPRDVLIVDAEGRPLLGGDLDRRFFEAAWMHKHGGLYYLSYSTGQTHFIVYATGKSSYGPFTYRGRILQPVTGWTTHHSIVEVGGRSYLFYHDAQLSGRTHLRNAKVTELTYDADGAIQTIDPFIR
jgi:hypothetical protein